MSKSGGVLREGVVTKGTIRGEEQNEEIEKDKDGRNLTRKRTLSCLLKQKLIAFTDDRQDLDGRGSNQLPDLASEHDQRHNPIHKRLHIRPAHLVRTGLDHLDHLLTRALLSGRDPYKDGIGSKDQTVKQSPARVLGTATRLSTDGRSIFP